MVPMNLKIVLEFVLQAVNATPQPVPSLPILMLAVVAVVAFAARLRIARSHTRLVVIGVIWASIPMVLSIVAAMVRPALLRPRYWMPAVVPLAVLAAVGALIVVDLVWHLVRGHGQVARARLVVATVAAAVVLGLVLVTQAVAVRPPQLAIRKQAGHALSLAPALALVDTYLESEPDLPFTVTPNTRTTVVWATRPDLVERDVLFYLDQSVPSVWPPARDTAEVARRTEGHSTMLWMRAAISGTTVTLKTKPKVPPKALQDLGFTVISAQRAGNWWICILQREEK